MTERPRVLDPETDAGIAIAKRQVNGEAALRQSVG
jgi:hypothetical protein